MKRSNLHKALTAKRVLNETKPGRYADGGGLYLVIDKTGLKRWVLRIVVPARGKRCDISLGSVNTVSLAHARDAADKWRKLAKDGGDPITVRMESRNREAVPTFKQAALIVHEGHAKAWKNPKHAQQWITTLEQYAFPVFGRKAVNLVSSADVLKALQPIWLEKPETARRVKQRIKAVFDWAKAKGYRSDDNPVEGITKALPKQTASAEHHAALPYSQVPQFVETLRKANAMPSARLAFELLILTAARTGEVLGAKPAEFDLDNKVWTVPAERMKAKKEHRVPLSRRAVEIVQEALALNGAYVFPGRYADKPLSDMALMMVVRRDKLGDITAHGFRSTFRDWAAERTHFPSDVCERALAHTIKNKVQAAYERTDLFEKRRELMDTWAAYVMTKAAKVITLRA